MSSAHLSRVSGRRASTILAAILALVVVNCSGCPPKPVQPGPQTGTFLDEGDFDGSYTPRGKNTYYGGEAIFNGRFVFTNLPREIVDDVLPQGFELAPRTVPLAGNTGAGQNDHPVAMSWGHQTHTKIIYPFWTPEVGDDYQEVILFIPFVRKIGGTLWHNYIVRMYVNSEYALYAGNLYYGVMKKWGAFDENASGFDVFHETILTFQSAAAAKGPWISDANAAATLNNYQDWKRIWSMPLLGSLLWSPGKPKVCMYFEWDFDDMQVRPIGTAHEFKNPFMSNMQSWVALGEVPSVVEGAWEVKGLRWGLGFPAISCQY